MCQYAAREIVSRIKAIPLTPKPVRIYLPLLSQVNALLEQTTLTIAGLAGAWAATVSGTWTLFEKADANASDTARDQARSLAKSGAFLGASEKWAKVFMNAFDSIFGDRLVSWSAFGRSCIASVCCFAIAFLVWAFLRPQQLNELIHSDDVGFELLASLLVVAMFNIIPDYLSLIQTRWFIGRLQMSRRSFAAILLLIGNAIASALIGLITSAIIVSLTYDTTIVRALFDRSEIQEIAGIIAQRVIPMQAEPGRIPIGLFPYASFFTSIWLWLYCLSSALLKLTRGVGFAQSAVTKIINVEEKPFAALGAIAVLLESALFFVIAVMLVVARVG